MKAVLLMKTNTGDVAVIPWGVKEGTSITLGEAKQMVVIKDYNIPSDIRALLAETEAPDGTS